MHILWKTRACILRTCSLKWFLVCVQIVAQSRCYTHTYYMRWSGGGETPQFGVDMSWAFYAYKSLENYVEKGNLRPHHFFSSRSLCRCDVRNRASRVHPTIECFSLNIHNFHVCLELQWIVYAYQLSAFRCFFLHACFSRKRPSRKWLISRMFWLLRAWDVIVAPNRRRRGCGRIWHVMTMSCGHPHDIHASWVEWIRSV